MAWRSVVPGRTVARVGRPEVSAQLLLLGPVELFLDDEPLQIGGERQRAVLACLAVHSRSTVLTEALIDAVWGDAAPTSVDKSLTTLLARLRKPLVRCGGTIEHTGAGYRLTMPDDAIDVLCFDQLVAAARADAATGRHEAAVGRLRAALELWRGAPMADVADAPFVAAAASYLQAQRIEAEDAFVQALIHTGARQVVFVEGLPKAKDGKVQRWKLRNTR